ncbi:Queuine tRNA-ribosyltransferase subunit QTRTD1-like protein [Trichoplax sp. H2]|nr:Queuine tRNA-ribosyltransferase subunit QTRTD1-like protein [Trichoplax sp. H2]|eukprot:RDD43396.1 Queuine tRNA-ribosyltransferase subunit QTRTD1-like protein [Trichoplax sp. H2]
MNFKVRVIDLAGSCCRLGALQFGSKVVETPGCLIYNRSGVVPHLTPDILETLDNVPPIMHTPLASIIEEPGLIKLRGYGKGLASFIGYKDNSVYISASDYQGEAMYQYNENKSISVWTKTGRTKVTPDDYSKFVEVCRPSWYQSLCDTVPANASIKRTRKSVDRTLEFLDQCLKYREKHDSLKTSELWAAVEGGGLVDERQRSAKESATRPVFGFTLEGFGSDQMNVETIFELLPLTTQNLPVEKPRLIHAIGSPTNIIKAIESGVDLFDAYYPYNLTENNLAMVLPLKAINSLSRSSKLTEVEEENGNDSSNDQDRTATFSLLNLREDRYNEDFSPLVSGCKCFVCSNHTRAYIHHLIINNEMLGGVLLMTHNLFQYIEFFRCIRTSLKNNKWKELRKLFDA